MPVLIYIQRSNISLIFKTFKYPENKQYVTVDVQNTVPKNRAVVAMDKQKLKLENNERFFSQDWKMNYNSYVKDATIISYGR